MRRIARIMVGGILLLVGLVMLVLPGPALIVIPVGLTILAVDFRWARAVMHKVRTWVGKSPKAPASKPQGW